MSTQSIDQRALARYWNGFINGNHLTARIMRTSALTVLGFGGGQVLRLASNLILTRLLFPEAFGMMVLVMMVMQGLQQFSDLGVTQSIMGHKRGDDRDFLNTAWTVKVVRGFFLWVLTCCLAWPFAHFYEAPELLFLLPVAGLNLVISGFNPTRLDTANRHLMLGRVTALEFIVQVVGIIVAVLVAWATGSVWALILSGSISQITMLVLSNVMLPGERNQFHWDKAAASDLIRFGKWIFLSTIAGFLLWQGDKIVLGKYLTLEALGIYNIGFFLANFPLMLGGMVTNRILIPVYRELPPSASKENFRKLQRLRFMLSAATLSLLFALAYIGVWLVTFLYDPRYELAGGILVLVACAQAPIIIALTYDQAALASGDSRQFFVLAAARASFMLGGLIIGTQLAGLIGALAGAGLAMVAVYPVVVWLARRQGTWDPLHDFVFLALSSLLATGALWLNWVEIAALVALNSP